MSNLENDPICWHELSDRFHTILTMISEIIETHPVYHTDDGIKKLTHVAMDKLWMAENRAAGIESKFDGSLR